MSVTPTRQRPQQSSKESPTGPATNLPQFSAGKSPKTPTKALAVRCPICGEATDSLGALNTHIDHKHAENAPSPVRTPQKRTIKLDLYENSMGFGLSDRAGGDAAQLGRAHWKQPAPGAVCSAAGCARTLGVKNGVVNCRRCGDLFCNHHTRFQVRLRNRARVKRDADIRALPEYDSSGEFARCCEGCFLARPGSETQVGARDVTADFVARRAAHSEARAAARATLRRRFLKLVHLHAQGAPPAAERDLLASDWQDDTAVSHCPLCFVAFGFFVRKHHCRLCGMVVSDAAYNSLDPNLACSRNVPVGVFMERLPQLNYSPLVRQHWDLLLRLARGFRCCRTCKDTLVAGAADRAGDAPKLEGPEGEVLAAYSELLSLKTAINAAFLRCAAVDADDHPRLRMRLQKLVKDFESASGAFRRRFFEVSPESGKYSPTQAPVLVTNVYNMALVFLQELLVRLKRLNDEFLRHTQELKQHLAQATEPPSASPALPPKPRLTLRQIRELREELMVTNEQRFLVEKLVAEATQQRRFDELQPLNDNIRDLTLRIKQLEVELGEFGF